MRDLKDLKGPVPDPYFAQRVLALQLAASQNKKLIFWRFFSGFSVACGLLLSLFLYTKSQSSRHMDYATAPIHKSMVLQLDSVPQDSRIVFVTLEIDEGMSFDIGNPSLAGKRELTVAIDDLRAKKLRLPFVFRAQSVGKKTVRLKFLDSEFNVVKEDLHYLEFYENNKKEIKI